MCPWFDSGWYHQVSKKDQVKSLKLKEAHGNGLLFLLLICIIGFLVRLAMLPFTQITDADAVSRFFIAKELVSGFYLIHEGVWLPLHHYLNTIAIFIAGGSVYGPVVIHMLFASLTAIPLYFFTRREFSSKGAWFAAAFYVFCPVIFRNSFQILPGIPYAFFVAAGMNFLSLAIRKNKTCYALYSGLMLTLASGFRYEAWLLIAAFWIIILLFKKWKTGFAFLCMALIIPVYWMTGNYLAHHHFLFGIPGVYNAGIVEAQNAGISQIEYLKRIVFFPFSWLFLLSPVVFISLLVVTARRQTNRLFKYSFAIWLIPFVIMLISYMYKCYNGTLLMQHRFSITLILLSAPLTSLIFINVLWTPVKKALAVILLASLLPLSHLWMLFPYEILTGPSTSSFHQAIKEIRLLSFSGLQSLPRLNEQETVGIADIMVQNLKKDDGLIIDFAGWENTYYMAIASGLEPENIFIIQPDQDHVAIRDKVLTFLDKYQSGMVVLSCYSKFSNDLSIEGKTLRIEMDKPVYAWLTPVCGNENMHVLRYEMTSGLTFPANQPPGEVLFRCPEVQSKSWYIRKIKDDMIWHNDIRIKALIRNIPVSEAIGKNAEYMVLLNQQNE